MFDGRKEKKSEVGPPGWIVTFADLMSLLLTFFILLLSFAETDVRKFKEAIGSIRNSFGVYSDVEKTHSFNVDDSYQSQWWGLTRPMIPLEANEICELERQREVREKSDIEYLKYQIEKDLSKELLENQGLHVGMEGSKLRVRFLQDHFFKRQTALFHEKKMNLIKKLFSILSERKLYIDITNYSEALESSPKAFEKWKLSTDRSLTLAYITRQMDEASIHEIKVKSVPYDHEPKRNDIIDLFIDLKDAG